MKDPLRNFYKGALVFVVLICSYSFYLYCTDIDYRNKMNRPKHQYMLIGVTLVHAPNCPLH